MVLSDERKFATFARGKVRDDILLARFRTSLRTKINPDTGSLFTETEIAIITQEDSRFFIEADAIDLVGQAIQSRALWFSEQIRPERASSGFLQGFHGPLWLPDGLLPATGGSGTVLATGSPGTIYVGSTTIGSAAANVARDPNGKRYQVLVTNTADSNGEAVLQMQAIDPGDSSNPVAGTVFTWVRPPIGTDTQASVVSTFSGGFNAETENEFAQRILRTIRYKPGCGNSAMFRLWGEQASNAVESVFVYATALHAGSVIVTVLQKRGSIVGPLARFPSIGTLAVVTAQLSPPTSPKVPHGIYVLATPPISETSDLALKLSMPKGSSGGWADTDPWPKYSVAYQYGVKVTTISDQTHWSFATDVPPTNLAVGGSLSGTDLPLIMLWDDDESKFELLDIASMSRPSTNVYSLVLNNAPNKTVISGDVLSPYNNRVSSIEESLQAYFDGLGPGELVDSTDSRFVRAARFPNPDQEWPTRVGQSIISTIDDWLGGALAEAELSYASKTEPSLPTEYLIPSGPHLLIMGRVGIYSFD